MNGAELIRKLKKLGKVNGVEVFFEKNRGKGSHGMLSYGVRSTTLKDRKKEIGPGLLNKILNDLNIKKEDL
jgi:mRNA interferase HicA